MLTPSIPATVRLQWIITTEIVLLYCTHSVPQIYSCIIVSWVRVSPGAAVKLCLGDLLVMGSNPEIASLHMQG